MNSGIYEIRNIITEEVYIGSTNSFGKRKCGHFSRLRRNKYINSKLQSSYNKYGVDSFKFSVLITCPEEYLLKLEQWFLDNIKPALNIRTRVTSGKKWSEHHKIRRISTSKKKEIKQKTGKKTDIYLNKVRQVSINGEILKEWDSIRQAANYFSIKPAVILTNCKGLTNYVRFTNSKWIFSKDSTTK